MKNLKTFFTLLDSGIKNHQKTYEIITRYMTYARTPVFAKVKKTGNIDNIIDKFINDLVSIKKNTSHCVFQIYSSHGNVLMQFVYVFSTEEIICEFASNDTYSDIGMSAVSEVDFFNSIGYYEYDSNDL